MNDAKPAAQERPRLLVVDDQQINVQALYRALADAHQIFVATSGEQALTLCLDKLPDLVLLDVVMPGIDGFEVCRRLKADPRTAHIPVIFVTASNDEAAETHGLDLGAADFISKPISPAIVRARVRTQLTLKAQADLLRQMAFIDGLTGIWNRRAFDERLSMEGLRAGRNRQTLSVVLIDVDFFKRYNDRYGHQAGDDCLRRVASTLAALLNRPADMLARYGGEEFVCVLPDTDAVGALEVAGRLERGVREQAMAHADSAAAAVVTVSLGVATLAPDRPCPMPELLARADAQLYRAKTEGRGRACGEKAGPA
nr:diguanylate cyclase [uncultured Roseateles sp.]